jgi:hypothetical protein
VSRCVQRERWCTRRRLADDTQVWDRLEGRALADLSGNRTGRVFSVVGDRVRVATAGMDCRIMLWDFGQGLDTAFVEP